MTKIRYLLVVLVISLFAFSVFAQPQTNTQELQELTKFFDDFSHTWLVEQNIDKAVEFFDNKKLDSNVRKIFSITPSTSSFDSNIWLRKVLTMWLVNDHGQMEEYGHGEPDKPGYTNLPLNPSGLEDKDKVKWQNVEEAIKYSAFPSINKADDPNGDLSQDSYIVTLTLNNAPREILIFILEKVGDKWKITGHVWLVA